MEYNYGVGWKKIEIHRRNNGRKNESHDCGR